jgi:putative membrane protein
VVYLIVNWVLSVVSLLLLAALYPGIHIMEFQSALIATGVVGLVSAGLGVLVKNATGPVFLGISAAFLGIADTILFRLSALLVPGFSMRGFVPAIAGAVVLLGLNLALMRVTLLRESPLDSESWMRP